MRSELADQALSRINESGRGETVERAEDGDGDLFGAEEIASKNITQTNFQNDGRAFELLQRCCERVLGSDCISDCDGGFAFDRARLEFEHRRRL
jgi:hypothetical protein